MVLQVLADAGKVRERPIVIGEQVGVNVVAGRELPDDAGDHLRDATPAPGEVRVRVTVSGRLHGRAKGGMADTIRRRMQRPDSFLDDRLEPADAAVRRSSLRRRARLAFSQPHLFRSLLRRLGCGTLEAGHSYTLTSFGAAWAAVEQGYEALRRQPVAVTDLPVEMARAVHIRDALRRRAAHSDTAEGVMMLEEAEPYVVSA